MSMRDQVRWAVVGTSGWADHTFARAIAAGGGALIGAAGSSREGSAAFAARHFAPRIFGSVEEVGDCDDVDAVWVASPSNQHHDHALMLLRAGKHVLVEKPLALNVVDGEEMVAEAAGSGRVTAVGFQHRFNPAHRFVAELVQEGHLGPLTFARLHMFIQAPDLPTPWRRSVDTSGGWAINDLGSHLLDLLNFIVTGFSTVASSLTAARFELDADDLAIVLLRRGAASAVLDVSTGLADKESRLELFGLDGQVVVEDSWPGGGRVRFGSEVRSFGVADTYAAQVRAFNEAVASEGGYGGADWPAGLAVVRQVADAHRLAANDDRGAEAADRTGRTEDGAGKTAAR